MQEGRRAVVEVERLEPGAALIRMTTTLGPRIQAARVRSGLTAPQLQTLRVVRLGGAAMGEVAARLGVPKSSATSVVDQLVDASLVRREPDPVDRRRQLVRPTRAGTRALDAFDAEVAGITEDLLAVLSPRRRTRLRQLLARLPDPVFPVPIA
jgi:DNA-binding MarR family transcriptional regulator